MIKQLDKQENIKPKRDLKGRLLPGNTANPQGRPKGKTLKEFAREFLAMKTEKEKMAYLKSLSKDFVWKMAEGAPRTGSDIDIKSEDQVIKGFNYIIPEGSKRLITK